ncbi:MAG TPA: hypothetical protein VJM08_11270, partial [Anaerolineales bacterium]|nr:hypothetical protein [Anaerolineales bacterium]
PQTIPVPAVKPEPPSPAPKPAVPVVRPAPQKSTLTVMKAEASSISSSAPLPKTISATPITPKPATAPRKAAAPPKPPRPPIDWRKVIVEAATSGALLRALLYLGAFMIVVSATVLVIRFWDQFHPVIQLLFIASVPLSFYAGGWALRVRLKLIQAGTVLTGIGALLVVVDFGAIYQLGGVGQDNGWLYWLLVSIFCTALHTFTAWRLEGEFFDYLPLIGGTSVLFTFTRFLRLDVGWSVVSITVSGSLMTLLASHYRRADGQWHDFGSASRYLSQILIPASLFYIIFSPEMPPVGQMAGFLVATAGYLVLAWQFPSFLFAYAGLGASVGTVTFALQVGDVSFEWYPAAASLLALAYILISQRLQKSRIEPAVVQKYIMALNTTGLILLSIGAVGGFVISLLSNDVWPGIVAMTLSSFDLIICAYFFHKSRYTLVAAGLFIAPFSMAIIEWFDIFNIQTAPGIAWLTFAWSTLALLYTVLGAALRKAESHNRWLYLWAHILIPIAISILSLSYIIDAAHWTSGPALVSLGTSICVYVFSFILQDSGKYSSLTAISNWLPYGLGKSVFLWPIGLLFPIWCAVAWYATDLPSPWFGTMLTALGFLYTAMGQVLFWRAKEYRLPFHVVTYALCILGILISSLDRHALFVAVLITAISAAILAYLYNRVLETIFASFLFLWSFHL